MCCVFCFVMSSEVETSLIVEYQRFLDFARNDSKALIRNNRGFLNFVCVFCKLIAKHTRETNVVQNDHIGVVFFVVVVLPPFIPPAETDDAGPSI